MSVSVGEAATPPIGPRIIGRVVAAIVASLLAGLSLWLGIAAPLWASDKPTRQAVLTLDKARLIHDQTSPAPSPPCAKDAPGQIDLTLPDLWRKRQRSTGSGAWYCLSFDPPDAATASGLAVYIPRAYMNLELWLNGQRVAGWGRMDKPVSERWNRPFLAALPAALLSKGSNALAIRLETRKGAPGGLSRVMVGPQQDLLAAYEQRVLWQWDLAMAASFTVSLLGALALIYGWRSRETLALYFGGAMSLWGSRNLYYFVDGSFDPHWLWNLLVIMPTLVAGVWLLQFVLRWHGRRLPRFEQALWGMVLLYALAVVTLTVLEKDHWLPLLGLPFGLFQLAVIALAAWETGRRPNLQNLIMVVSLFLSFAGSLWDLSLRATLWGFEAYHLRHFSALPFALAMTLMLAQRHVQALLRTERAEASAREARHAERRRLMRDMHDGLGAQLVTALATMHGQSEASQRARKVLQEALDELRLIIESLDREQRNLGELIGTLCYRFASRMEDNHQPLAWHIEPALAGVQPTAQASLDLLRIIQESLANAVKHGAAGGTQVNLSALPFPEPSATLATPGCLICISNALPSGDHPSGPRKPGHSFGLKNMQARAKALDGRLSSAPRDGRWIVSLHLSISALTRTEQSADPS